MMFDGIRFCIFLDGWDMLQPQQKEQTPTHEDQDQNQDRGYADIIDLPSLHMFRRGCNDGQILFQRYGGRIDKRNSNDNNTNTNTNTNGENQNQSQAKSYIVDEVGDTKTKIKPNINTKTINKMKAMNEIGKFAVAQKKIILAEDKVLVQQLALASGDDSGDGDHGSNDYTGTLTLLEKTRMELAAAEMKAIELINKTVAANPPKALMAVIAPDTRIDRQSHTGMLVGGWSGEKDAFRSDDFKKSGGAPCPKEFTKKVGLR
uniref:Uncharacterized protein n=1 Tax=Chaetoceros debilis TaxID=122233 RepID=A0A7S3QC40_9STRA